MKTMTTKMKLGHLLKKTRTLRNDTQEELSKTINLDRTTIAKIESGNRRVPMDALASVAKYLNTTLDKILRENIQ